MIQLYYGTKRPKGLKPAGGVTRHDWDRTGAFSTARLLDLQKIPTEDCLICGRGPGYDVRIIIITQRDAEAQSFLPGPVRLISYLSEPHTPLPCASGNSAPLWVIAQNF